MVIMISLYKTNGQLKLTNPVVKVEPVKPFTFLVDGARISVANTVRLEQLDVLIGIDFSGGLRPPSPLTKLYLLA